MFEKKFRFYHINFNILLRLAWWPMTFSFINQNVVPIAFGLKNELAELYPTNFKSEAKI